MERMWAYVFMASMLMYKVAAIRLLGNPTLIIGGHKDENGCLVSAGYKWCNYTESCVSVNEICMPQISERPEL